MEPRPKKLYGAIVARTRLPVFYQDLGVPDTLEGRFAVLSLHLFAVLHRLKDDGAEAAATAQSLADLFTSDMETVLREVGVGDLSIPKKVRKLIASGAGLLQSYEEAYSRSCGALEDAIASALPGAADAARASAARLAPYVKETICELESQPLRAIQAGTIRFARI